MDARKRGRLGLTFILITLMLDAMGIGLIIPVMPDLIREIGQVELGTAAAWGGLLAATFAAMQFLFGPTLGNLSDRYGRRPVLLLSLAVMAFAFWLMAVAQSMLMLFVARVVGGITAATQATAAAYIADISPPEKKSANFGLVGAAFGFGFVLGPVIGGELAEFGPRAPFIAAALLSLGNMIYGYFVLPETVDDRIRRPFEWRRANPLGAFQTLSKYPEVIRFVLLIFLYEFAFIVYPAIWAYFTQEQFGWGTILIGRSLGAFGIALVLVQGILIRWIIPRIGERATIMWGFSFNLLSFGVLAFLQDGRIALMFIPLAALGAVVTPALTGRMSLRVGDDQQGELQGAIASARALAMILSPLVMTQVFFIYTTGGGLYAPGAPFVLSAALMLVCMVVFLTRKRIEPA